jgi:hypothetical protein
MQKRSDNETPEWRLPRLPSFMLCLWRTRNKVNEKPLSMARGVAHRDVGANESDRFPNHSIEKVTSFRPMGQAIRRMRSAPEDGVCLQARLRLGHLMATRRCRRNRLTLLDFKQLTAAGILLRRV